MLRRQASWAWLALGCAVAVAESASAQELRLADGREAVAAGIFLAGAVPVVAGLVPMDPTAVVLDRHGRVRAQLQAADGAWLQAALVASGQAIVAPAGDLSATDLASLLALERTAREERQGVWADGRHGPWPAERVAARRGEYVLPPSGSDGLRRTSRRSWTAVSTLLTFWPPGPEARRKLSSISRSSRLSHGVITSISAT